jgi:hypothetical protein
MVTAWDDERSRLNRIARRRHKAAAAERAQKLEHRRLRAIEEQIAETPAEGLTGMAVQMALWQHYNWDLRRFHTESDKALASAYETVVKLRGVDLATQVERW